jgi:aspartate ammonia-lyase
MISMLQPELENLSKALHGKGAEFDRIIKSGRTHLQDAVPIRLGQEFEAYAVSIDKNIRGLENFLYGLYELGLGGTAVGTGLNAEVKYIETVVARYANRPVSRFFGTEPCCETTQNMDPFVVLSSALKGLAINLTRICNDLRLLSSGLHDGA